jgi:hypothetical protein
MLRNRVDGKGMTQKQYYAELVKMIEEYTKEHGKTAKSARAALIREGIYTRTGRLKKKFDERLDLEDTAA